MRAFSGLRPDDKDAQVDVQGVKDISIYRAAESFEQLGLYVPFILRSSVLR